LGEIEMRPESDTAFTAPTHPGIRATLRALVGRLGTPDLAAAEVMGLAALPLHSLEPSVDWDEHPREAHSEEETACTAARAA
jgi:hypothetical protein